MQEISSLRETHGFPFRYLKQAIPPIGAAPLLLLALLLFNAPPFPALQMRTLLALEALGVRSQPPQRV